jgi:hypothetical protein
VRVLFCFHRLFLILILYKKLLMLNELINHHRFQLQNNGLLNILFFLSIFTLNLGNDIKNHNTSVRSRCPVEKLLWLHLPSGRGLNRIALRWLMERVDWIRPCRSSNEMLHSHTQSSYIVEQAEGKIFYSKDFFLRYWLDDLIQEYNLFCFCGFCPKKK